MERTQIGEFTAAVVETLNLDIEVGTPIFVGESNLEHMKKSHPKIYEKYGARMTRIINEPDYVGQRSDGTIEFIKAFGMYIKVAARVTAAGDFYVRTIFHKDKKAAERLIKSGDWKPLKFS